MNDTLMYLCKNIQGCKIGYTQSDEITLLLVDYDTITTDAWFDYSVQKMCSIAASMATLAFNKSFAKSADDFFRNNIKDVDEKNEDVIYFKTLMKAVETGAMFDARCFNIPEDEVVNCFIWRQQDATRNAIQMLGQCNFPHKALQGKSCNDIQDMLMTIKGINFNDMPVEFKRGVCCIKVTEQDPDVDIKDGYAPVTYWKLDKDIPIFTQDRSYIEKCFNVKEK
jgi:tRNA(His) 5'-end guanylyltransferase